MTISEILGLVLAVIGVAFAFQTPRTWFLRVARLSRSDHSHIDDESPRITLSSNEAPTMIEEFISSSPAPTDGATIANDSGLHKLPHLWMQTNHSNADIIWVTEVAKRNQIGSIASHYYGQLIQGVTQIEKAAHTETSDVYRICNPSDVRHAICLKVFRRLQDADQLRRLCAVQKQIAGSGIFQDYSEYLRPLTTTTGADWVQPEDGHTKQAIAFRFLNEAKTKEATHFKGLSEQEIESVAEKFGRINDVFLNSSLGVKSRLFVNAFDE